MPYPGFSCYISFHQFQYGDIPTVICQILIKRFFNLLFQFSQGFALPFPGWQFISRLQFPAISIVHLTVPATISIHKLSVLPLLFTCPQYTAFAVPSLLTCFTHIFTSIIIKIFYCPLFQGGFYGNADFLTVQALSLSNMYF